MKRISNLFYLLGQGVKERFQKHGDVHGVHADSYRVPSCARLFLSYNRQHKRERKAYRKAQPVVATLDDDLTQEQIDSITSEIGKMDNVLSVELQVQGAGP